eukprot:scaffold679731_cov78-Prasinocladus_malaysianus.AAC.1
MIESATHSALPNEDREALYGDEAAVSLLEQRNDCTRTSTVDSRRTNDDEPPTTISPWLKTNFLDMFHRLLWDRG